MNQPRPYDKYLQHDDRVIKGFFEKYRFLSNYDASPVFFEGLLYPCVENAYQAAKCYMEHDRKRFLTISPAEAKKLGNAIPLRDDWEQVKYDIMLALVFEKFWRHPDKRRALLETGNRYLEETNHWNDRTWGVCNGVGTNWLGDILMKVRAVFKNSAPSGKLPVFTRSQFLNHIADNQPEPWSTMAANMLIFGEDPQGFHTLLDKFPCVLIPG